MTPNRPPRFIDGNTTNRSVVENSESGASIGRPVAASDADGDTLSYTLGGADAASFDIEASSGQLKTKAELDLETKSSYTVTVSVGDGKGSSGASDPAPDDRITVTITVTYVELTEKARKYDRDENGLIDRDEVIVAVNDYFKDGITREDVLEVLKSYFESPATDTGGQGGDGR